MIRAMVDVVVLGSGTPNPTPGRAGSALAVVDGSAWMLVDCGRSATQRALDAGLDLTLVAAVLLTHHHSDHLNDLATFATTRWTAGAATPLTVVAPEGPAASYAAQCLSIFDPSCFLHQADPDAGPRPTIRVETFTARSGLTSVLAFDGWLVHSALVDHHPIEPAVGYRIERSGFVISVSGDTAVCDGMHLLARSADVLVHEALLSGAVSPQLLEWNASAQDVGQLAAAVHARQLVLTHLIPAPSGPDDEAAFLAEVHQGGFAGPTHVARDMLRIRART